AFMKSTLAQNAAVRKRARMRLDEGCRIFAAARRPALPPGAASGAPGALLANHPRADDETRDRVRDKAREQHRCRLVRQRGNNDDEREDREERHAAPQVDRLEAVVL